MGDDSADGNDVEAGSGNAGSNGELDDAATCRRPASGVPAGVGRVVGAGNIVVVLAEKQVRTVGRPNKH